MSGDGFGLGVMDRDELNILSAQGDAALRKLNRRSKVMSIQDAAREAEALKRDFEHRWGGFRRWLAKHPLMGAWASLGVGVVVGLVLSPLVF